jgi:hypothetical protein
MLLLSALFHNMFQYNINLFKEMFSSLLSLKINKFKMRNYFLDPQYISLYNGTYHKEAVE